MSRVHELTSSGTIRAFCQPIFDLTAKVPSLHSVECLSRGPAATPFENPAVLFEYARRMLFEPAMDLHCSDIAMAACSSLPLDLPVAINVHASSLGRSTHMAESLLALCSKRNIDPKRLTVEIVEQAPAENMDSLLRNIACLREHGASIAIDDFGAGHSNYLLLLAIHPEIVKLDRALISGLHENQYQRNVTESIVRLALATGLTVIAEGVEDIAELKAIRELGISLAQGFALAQPFPTADFRSRYPVLHNSKIPGSAQFKERSETLTIAYGGLA